MVREANGSLGGRVAPTVLLLSAVGKAGHLCPIALVRAVSAATAGALVNPFVAVSCLRWFAAPTRNVATGPAGHPTRPLRPGGGDHVVAVLASVGL